MAPLRPSADIPHVGTQKDIYGLRVAQNTIDGLIMNYIHHPIQLVIFTLLLCQVIYATLYICNSRVICESRLLHVVYICICGLPLEKLVDHTRVSSLDTRVYLPLTLKIKTCDYLRLVKPFTLISLTVSTSSTFETALFHQL